MTDPADPDLTGLAQDWVTLWQSEMTALARDREAQEQWAMLVGFWANLAGQTIAARAALIRTHDQPAPRSTRTHDPARPATAAAASHSGGQPGADQPSLAQLHRRIADLEQRLAALDQRRERGTP